MKQYLELIRKKKQYIYRLKKELEIISQQLKNMQDEEKKYNNQNANLYIKLNKLQMSENESSIITYTILASFMLFFISLFVFSIFNQMILSSFQILLTLLAFDITQIAISFITVKLTRKYYQKRREQSQDDITKILKEIQTLNGQRFTFFHKQNILKNRKSSIINLILTEEEDVDFISKKLVDTLLNFEQKIDLPNLDDIIDDDIIKQEKVRKRELNHFEY